MDATTNENLLPEIIEKKLELGLSGANISLKDFLIVSGKTAAELSEVITDKICSLSTARAQTIWKALDEESKFELAYSDNGTFNLSLVEKLNLRGVTLKQAFTTIHAKSIFDLDAAPLSSAAYVNAFTVIQSELLATCKQLFAAKADGRERLTEFLSGFETDFLASLIRHEIARYYIDEEGAELDFDMMENEAGGIDFIRQDPGDDASADDGGYYRQPEPLEEFNNTFIKGGTVPPRLEFTSWLQQHAPEIYSVVLNILIFFASEQGVPVWERPNPTDEEEKELETTETPFKHNDDKDRFARITYDPNPFRERTLRKEALVSVESEKEVRRLIRVYCITSPLKNDFIKVGQQDFSAQAKVIATILSESGKDTSAIQTFEQLKKAVWDTVGFTSLNQWVHKQDNPQRLISSSGKKWLFDEMKVLGVGAFATDAIFFEGLEKSKGLVLRLFGWLSLVKIFWSIADQNKRFTDLATIKNDTLYWEENITCCTLIFQLVLGTDKLFFSLEDVSRFCEMSREPEWVDTMQRSFRELADQHNAISAVPIFDEHINHLSHTGTNIFRIADQILLATKAERELVAVVKEKAEEHVQLYIRSYANKEKTEFDLRSELDFHFAFTMVTSRINDYRKEATDYLNHLIEQFSIPGDIDLGEFDLDA